MGWFSSRHYSSSSSYRRRPREGFIKQLLRKIRKALREILSYAQRHPFKVFFVFIMPLVTGGALHGIMKQFGVHLPPGLFGGARGGGGFGGARDLAGLASGAGGIQGLVRLAQAFM
jgi:hypothetical protein